MYGERGVHEPFSMILIFKGVNAHVPLIYTVFMSRVIDKPSASNTLGGTSVHH